MRHPETSTGHSGGRRKKHLGLVLTGGTVASTFVEDECGGTVEFWGRDGEVRGPELSLLGSAGSKHWDVTVRVPVDLLSEDLLPEDWLSIAGAIRSLVVDDRVDGVLVFHGTDTMAYTAAALSFLLADVEVPIVLTGANKPPNHPASDAGSNVHAAVVALAALGPAVYVAFAGGRRSPGWVHLGTRVRKVRASGPAFRSINHRPIGKVIGRRFHPITQLDETKHRRSAAAQKHEVDSRVAFMRVYPGLDFRAMDAFCTANDTRGVVLELYASATASNRHERFSAPAFVDLAKRRNVPVVTAIPSSPAGRLSAYESTSELQDAGAIFVGDMLPETATVKLMWALGQSRSLERVADLMRLPIAGELRSLG